MRPPVDPHYAIQNSWIIYNFTPVIQSFVFSNTVLKSKYPIRLIKELASAHGIWRTTFPSFTTEPCILILLIFWLCCNFMTTPTSIFQVFLYSLKFLSTFPSVLLSTPLATKFDPSSYFCRPGNTARWWPVGGCISRVSLYKKLEIRNNIKWQAYAAYITK